MKKAYFIFLMILVSYFNNIANAQNLLRDGNFETRNPNINNYYINEGLYQVLLHWKDAWGKSRYINSLNPLDSYIPEKITSGIVDTLDSPFNGKGCIFFDLLHITKDTNSLELIPFYKDKNKFGVGDSFYRFAADWSNAGFFQELSAPLQKDSFYYLSFRLKFGSKLNSRITKTPVNNNIFSYFGAHFTTERIFHPRNDVDPLNPIQKIGISNYKKELQDTIFDTTYQWRKVEMYFKADSAYRFIYFSQFQWINTMKYLIKTMYKHYLNLSKETIGQANGVIMIDEVKLLPESLYIQTSQDTHICENTSAHLKVLKGKGPYAWHDRRYPYTTLSYTNGVTVWPQDSVTVYEVTSPYDTSSVVVYSHKPHTHNDTIIWNNCKGQSYEIEAPLGAIWSDGSVYSGSRRIDTSGIYSYSFFDKCTTYNRTHQITIRKPFVFSENSMHCDQYTWRGKTYRQSGIYTDSLKGRFGCDSIYILNLTIKKSIYDTIQINTCNLFRYGDSVYNKSGIYLHSYPASNGCDSFVVLQINSLEVSAAIQVIDQIHFKALKPNLVYQWYLCNPWRKIENAFQQTLTTTTKAKFTVIVSDSLNQCRDTSLCVDKWYSSINNSSLINNIDIYPNPFSEELQLSIPIPTNCLIYNTLGQNVFEKQLTPNNLNKLNLGYLHQGIYFLHLPEINKVFKVRKE